MNGKMLVAVAAVLACSVATPSLAQPAPAVGAVGVEGPDGALYFLTDNAKGRIAKLVPKR